MDKAPDAFRTISEVADELKIPQHVLRFWESKFSQIRPMKRAGGRRYYRPDDVDLLRGIRHLLYTECYRIEGVQGILREQGPKFVQAVWQPGAPQPVVGPGDTAAEPEQLPPDEAARALFGLLKSPDREPVAPVSPALQREAGVSREDTRRLQDDTRRLQDDTRRLQDDTRRLQAALHELSECRRLLDAALRDEAA